MQQQVLHCSPYDPVSKQCSTQEKRKQSKEEEEAINKTEEKVINTKDEGSINTKEEEYIIQYKWNNR